MFDNYGNQPAPAQPAPPTPTRMIRFDKDYVLSTAGILKVVEILCNFIGFICIKISSQFLSAIFYNLLYWVGIVISLFLLLMYVFHFVEKFDQLPWLKGEFLFCVVMALTYIGCSIFAATIGESVGYAVGFFGLCAVIAYGLDGYKKFKLWKRGLPAQ